MSINSTELDIYLKSTENGDELLNEVVEGETPFEVLYQDIKRVVENIKQTGKKG